MTMSRRMCALSVLFLVLGWAPGSSAFLYSTAAGRGHVGDHRNTQ